MNNNPLTVAQILSAISRHRVKAFFAWASIMAIVLALYIVWPRQYGSEGLLYVKMDRNNSSVVPTSSTPVSIQDTRETEIRSVAAIIKSRAVLDSVVADVGAENILENGIADWIPKLSLPKFGSNPKGAVSKEEYEKLKKKELAVKHLRKSLDVFSEKKTSIISVYVKATSPTLAKDIGERIFEHTRRVHMGIHAVGGSADFFDEQFAAQEKILVGAVKSLADFRSELGVLSVGAARDSLQSIISTLDQSLLSAEVSLKESDERVLKLAELMKSTKAQVAMPTQGKERVGFEDSTTELFKLEAERQRLLARLKPSDPRVKSIDRTLAAMREKLRGMSANRTESALMLNPVYSAMQVDYLKAKAAQAANLARLESLKLKKAGTVAKLGKMNKAEVAADQKQRDVEIARQYLAIYTQKRGESKAMEMLDDRKISDVVISQKPTLPVKHVNPKGSLVLPLGFICGLIVALCTALFFDRNHLSATLNESEVEQVLDLPVLVTLPRVYSSRNMVN